MRTEKIVSQDGKNALNMLIPETPEDYKQIHVMEQNGVLDANASFADYKRKNKEQPEAPQKAPQAPAAPPQPQEGAPGQLPRNAQQWLNGNCKFAQAEVNFAEREKQLEDTPTDEMCYRHGLAHRTYNWARHPHLNWTDKQKFLYNLGYDGKPFPQER